jgi:hypothetical protein
MNNNLSKKVLEKIEKNNIQPKSKLFFVVKNYVFWFFVVLATIVLTFLFVSLFSYIQYIDFSVAERVSGGKIRHLFMFFPYSLLFLILIIFIFGIENFLHTKYSYRIEIKKIFLLIFFIAFVFGGVLSFFVNSEKIENYLSQNSFGLYHRGKIRREQMWVQPYQGLLAGSLLEFSDDKRSFDFIDFSGNLWNVEASSLTENDISLLNSSEYISIKGKQIDDSLFSVCVISEWQPRKFLHKNERKYFEIRINKCYE